ncbi:unnamed protein product, partial [Didymodactylos carnosus]
VAFPDILLTPTCLTNVTNQTTDKFNNHRIAFSQPFSLKNVTSEKVFDDLRETIESCPFVVADVDMDWNSITIVDIAQLLTNFNINDSQMLVYTEQMRQQFFLEILAALTICLSVYNKKNIPRYDDSNDIKTESEFYVEEQEMFKKMEFLIVTFRRQYLITRPCQTIHDIVQQGINQCLNRNYLVIDFIPETSLADFDTIHSDTDDDDDLNDYTLNDSHNKSETLQKRVFRTHFQEYRCQLVFFSRLIGSYIESICLLLKLITDSNEHTTNIRLKGKILNS